MIAFLTAQFASWGLPEPIRKAAAWATVIVAALAILWGMKAIYDASVIDEHERDRAIGSMDAHNEAADARAKDTIRDTLNEKGRNDAIDAAPTGGTLSDAERALNCERLRQLGRTPAACRPDGSD